MGQPPKPDTSQMSGASAPMMPPMPNAMDSKSPTALKDNLPSPPSAKDSPLASLIPGSNNGDNSQLKRGDGDSVTIDGFILRLASNIITAGTNPFLNRLNRPKPQEVSTTASLLPDPNAGIVSNPTPELPPADPLEHVNLTGVMYNTKYPMALMTVGTEQVARMVKVGEKLTVDPTHSFQVVKIRPDSIELKAPGSKVKTRFLKISSIIGQSSNGNATQDAAFNAYTNPEAGTPARPGRNGSDLSNLSKLMDLTNSPVDGGFNPNGRN